VQEILRANGVAGASLLAVDLETGSFVGNATDGF